MLSRRQLEHSQIAVALSFPQKYCSQKTTSIIVNPNTPRPDFLDSIKIVVEKQLDGWIDVFMRVGHHPLKKTASFDTDLLAC